MSSVLVLVVGENDVRHNYIYIWCSTCTSLYIYKLAVHVLMNFMVCTGPFNHN